MKQYQPNYHIKRIYEDTYCIQERSLGPLSVYMYLLVGEKKALLIDSGYGTLDLKEMVLPYSILRQAPKEPAKPDIPEAELIMAKTLISTMAKDFEPEFYYDEYQSRLWEIINGKIQGKEVITPKEEQPDNIIDLMDALKKVWTRRRERRSRAGSGQGVCHDLV